MKLNSFLSGMFALALICFSLSSCTKENPLNPAITDSPALTTTSTADVIRTQSAMNASGQSQDSLECFMLEFPIDLVYPDGSQETYSDIESLVEAVDEYYEDETDGDLTLAYPVTVTLEDGTTTTITTDDELIDLFEECDAFDEEDDEDDYYDDDDYDDEYGDHDCDDLFEDICFDLVFPITITDTNGNMVIVNDEEELENAIENLEDQAGDDEDFDILIEFPIDVILEDQSTLTIFNEEELDELIDSCEEERDDHCGDCDDDEDEDDEDDEDDDEDEDDGDDG